MVMLVNLIVTTIAIIATIVTKITTFRLNLKSH